MDETIRQICGPEAANHIAYLEATLIPDLRRAEQHETASDLIALIGTCRQLQDHIKAVKDWTQV